MVGGGTPQTKIFQETSSKPTAQAHLEDLTIQIRPPQRPGKGRTLRPSGFGSSCPARQHTWLVTWATTKRPFDWLCMEPLVKEQMADVFCDMGEMKKTPSDGQATVSITSHCFMTCGMVHTTALQGGLQVHWTPHGWTIAISQKTWFATGYPNMSLT